MAAADADPPIQFRVSHAEAIKVAAAKIDVTTKWLIAQTGLLAGILATLILR